MNSNDSKQLPEPRIAVFYCRQGHNGLPLGDFKPILQEPPVHKVHYICAHEVTTDHLRKAFAAGADGILLYGCLVRDCRTEADNLAVLRSLYRNTRMVKALGLSPLRLREEWATQEGTDHLRTVIGDFAAQLSLLGPARSEQVKAQAGPRKREGRA